MSSRIQVLDCTLRDGAYIVNGKFGQVAIQGIIKKLTEAHIDLIECGWLKDDIYKPDTSFFHVPEDTEKYLSDKSSNTTYVAMIDYNRYDDHCLPICNHKGIDAIRVVFPHGHQREGIEIASRIKDKGYKVFLQAANTLAYSEQELRTLVEEINELNPEAISIVDTFGAMEFEDIERITSTMDQFLSKSISLGFHSHNNQQLSYALSIRFIELAQQLNRDVIVDSSLCGMGRGAGNTTTELISAYLNRKQSGYYDMYSVLDAIDTYMGYFQENYTWGYSTPYMIAGAYCTHVNNIAYLLNNHRTGAKDIHAILSSMTQAERTQYDYELLEEKYLENQSRAVDDSMAIQQLKNFFQEKEILLIAPGKTSMTEQTHILDYIQKKKPILLAVNAILEGYSYDYLFFVNKGRYEYAENRYKEVFLNTPKILLSNIKTTGDDYDYILNYDKVIKRGTPHFDNAVITCLRMLNLLDVSHVTIAGFDGFKGNYNESYADEQLPTLNPEGKWEALNEEIKGMMGSVRASLKKRMDITFLTHSIFDE